MGATSKLLMCHSNYPLEHVLMNCEDVADGRPTFYNDYNLYNLFANIEGK